MNMTWFNGNAFIGKKNEFIPIPFEYFWHKVYLYK